MATIKMVNISEMDALGYCEKKLSCQSRNKADLKRVDQCLSDVCDDLEFPPFPKPMPSTTTKIEQPSFSRVQQKVSF